MNPDEEFMTVPAVMRSPDGVVVDVLVEIRATDSYEGIRVGPIRHVARPEPIALPPGWRLDLELIAED